MYDRPQGVCESVCACACLNVFKLKDIKPKKGQHKRLRIFMTSVCVWIECVFVCQWCTVFIKALLVTDPQSELNPPHLNCSWPAYRNHTSKHKHHSARAEGEGYCSAFCSKYHSKYTRKHVLKELFIKLVIFRDTSLNKKVNFSKLIYTIMLE